MNIQEVVKKFKSGECSAFRLTPQREYLEPFDWIIINNFDEFEFEFEDRTLDCFFEFHASYVFAEWEVK